MDIIYIDHDSGAVAQLMAFDVPELQAFGGSERAIWLITSLGVPVKNRRKGHGTRMLRKVCAQADREGAILCLSVADDGTGMGDLALRLWYAKHGFIPIDPYEPNSMYRPPRGM